jgi:hypothetical protein
MPRRSARTSLATVVWGLLLAGGIYAHRAGLMPAWVYHGRLRDEVKRRTGVDLADRSTPKPIVEVTNVHGQGGMHPTLTLDVRNATDSALRYLEMWAHFQLATKDAGRAAATVAGGGEAPLGPGETRHVTLRVQTAQGLGITTRGPLLTADVYWAFSRLSPRGRERKVPDMAMVPVR